MLDDNGIVTEAISIKGCLQELVLFPYHLPPTYKDNVFCVCPQTSHKNRCPVIQTTSHLSSCDHCLEGENQVGNFYFISFHFFVFFFH